MKRYLIGFVAGIVLAISLTALAVELNVVPNRFPIFVNNVKADIEAYNINGFTYLKLADIAKATGNTMGVKFDEVKGEIDITTTDTTVTPSPTVAPTEAPTAEPTATAVPTSTPDVSQDIQTYQKDGYTFVIENGVEYYPLRYVAELISAKGYSIMFNRGTKQVYMTYNDDPNGDATKTKTVLENIPYKVFDDFSCITKDYYTNTILPLIK